MTPTDLLILVLATAHAIEVFHHSSIFAGTRAWLEGYDNFIGDLFACAFCLSLWVGTLLACIYYFAGEYPAARLPIYALAVTRGANILNDVFYKFCRTPRASKMFEDD